MATADMTPNSSNNQPIGTTLVVHGPVQAQSADNGLRLLQAGSPVFLHDRIITGESGMITILFGDAARTQLDLGRMSDVLLDEDVFQGTPTDFSEATAEVEQIQEALLAGTFDPTTDLEPTAAGPAAAGPASDGGGSSYVEFSLTGEAVTPTSGAETTGVGLDFLDPPLSELEELIEPTPELEPEPEPVTVVTTTAPAPTPTPTPTVTTTVTSTSPDPSTPTPGQPVSIYVQEDALGNRNDEDDQSVGNEDDASDVERVIGSLVGTVGSDSDEPVSFKLVTIDFDSRVDSGLKSNNQTVYYTSDGTTLTAATDSGTVFTFTIDANGNYTFDLEDQLDHSGNEDDNENLQIELGQFVEATDADNDTINLEGLVSIFVENDLPEGGQSVSAYVQEDALGNRGDADDQSLANEDDASDVEQVSGSLAGAVVSGADEPATFKLVTIDSPLDSGLKSNNQTVFYTSDGTTLTAATVAGTVFTFTVDASGNYTFDLEDQLDHSGNEDDNENLQIELGQFVEATDADNDTINLEGLVSIFVENDLPTGGQLITAYVQEDALGNRSDAGDQSLGNLDDASDVEQVSGSLAGTVVSGADEPVSFALKAFETPLDSGLKSNNQTVFYTSDGTTLTAATIAGTVFTFTVDANGNYTFDLEDQLDHSGSEDDNENLHIELGQYVEATDADNDTINLEGLVSIFVENDLPTGGQSVTAYVQEDALGNRGDADDESLGNVDDASDIEQVSGSLAGTVVSGADEPASFKLVTIDSPLDSGLKSNNQTVFYTSDGTTLTAATIAGTVFTFTVEANGNYTFDLEDQLDHSGSEDDNENLHIELGQFVEATDADNDTTKLNGLVSIYVENDLPTIGLVSEGMLLGAVQEDSLGNEIEDSADDDTDTSTGILDAEADTDSATFNLADLLNTTSGADEPADVSYSITNLEEAVNSGYSSNGQEVWYFEEDGKLVARAGDGGNISGAVVFTLAVDSSTGVATFNLDDQLDHPEGSGDDYSLTLDGLGSYVQAEIVDADGDIASVTFEGRLAIDVENDVPTVSAQHVAMANEADLSVTGAIDIASGADEPVTVAFAPVGYSEESPLVKGYITGGPNENLNGDGVLTAGGTELIWVHNGNIWEAQKVDENGAPSGQVVFTVTPSVDGTSYTVHMTEMDGLDGMSQAASFDFTSGGSVGAHTGELLFYQDGLDPEDGNVTTDTIQISARALLYTGGTDPYYNPIEADSDNDEIDVNSSVQGMGVENGAKIDSDEALLLRISKPGGIDPNDEDSSNDTYFSVTNAQVLLDHLDIGEIAFFELYKNTDPGLQSDLVDDTVPNTGQGDLYGTLVASGSYVAQTSGGSSPAADEWLNLDYATLNKAEADGIGDPLDPEADTTGLTGVSITNTFDSADDFEFDTIVFRSMDGSEYRVEKMTIGGDETPGYDNIIEFEVTVTDADGDVTTDTFSISFDGDGTISVPETEALIGDSTTDTGVVIQGGEDDEVIIGGAGDDTIDGNGGDDTIDGGEGNDTIEGGAGDDILVGNVGDDVIYGDEDADALSGGAGEDQLVGGTGEDTLDGGQDDDVLVGDDVEYVDNPADPVIVEDEAPDVIDGGAGTDTAGDQPETLPANDDAITAENTVPDIDTLVAPPDDEV